MTRPSKTGCWALITFCGSELPTGCTRLDLIARADANMSHQVRLPMSPCPSLSVPVALLICSRLVRLPVSAFPVSAARAPPPS